MLPTSSKLLEVLDVQSWKVFCMRFSSTTSSPRQTNDTIGNTASRQGAQQHPNHHNNVATTSQQGRNKVATMSQQRGNKAVAKSQQGRNNAATMLQQRRNNAATTLQQRRKGTGVGTFSDEQITFHTNSDRFKASQTQL